MNRHLAIEKIENSIKELAEAHLALSSSDGCFLRLEGGCCVAFGPTEDVVELIEDDQI